MSTLATAFYRELDFVDVLYIVAFALFIYGLMGLTGPQHRGARQPDRRRRHGDRRRRDAPADPAWRQLGPDHRSAWSIGTVVGVPSARQVKMTAMPQMVALFNGVGGGAVALIAWAEFHRDRRLRRRTS